MPTLAPFELLSHMLHGFLGVFDSGRRGLASNNIGIKYAAYLGEDFVKPQIQHEKTYPIKVFP